MNMARNHTLGTKIDSNPPLAQAPRTAHFHAHTCLFLEFRAAEQGMDGLVEANLGAAETVMRAPPELRDALFLIEGNATY